MAHENLVKVLLNLAQKVPYLSELEHDGMMADLRDVEADLGASGIIPPKAGDTNAPLQAPAEAVAAAPDPGPLAEPVPAAEQLPPPASPELAGTAPEEANAFAETVPPETSPAQAAAEAAAPPPPV